MLYVARESSDPDSTFYHFQRNDMLERYCFSSQGIIYLNNVLWPYITNLTQRRRALTSEQILWITLRFFANCSFIYNIGNAEHFGKATVCRAVRKVILALKRLLPVMVVFPGHKPLRTIYSTGLQVTDVEMIYSIILNYDIHSAATSEWGQ